MYFASQSREECLNIDSSATLGSRKDHSQAHSTQRETKARKASVTRSSDCMLVAKPETTVGALSAFSPLHHHKKDPGDEVEDVGEQQGKCLLRRSSSELERGTPRQPPRAVRSNGFQSVVTPLTSPSPCAVHYGKHRRPGRAGAGIRRAHRRPLLSSVAFFSVSNTPLKRLCWGA